MSNESNARSGGVSILGLLGVLFVALKQGEALKQTKEIA